MRFFIKILIIVVFNGLLCSFVYGQTPTKALEIPVKYITPKEGVSLAVNSSRRPGSFWQVYSDKHGNITYETSIGKRVKNSIGFMDDFYAVDENDQRVHIIKDNNYREGFSSNAEDYGWIDKKNLLLWDRCLISKAGRINKKGMVLNTIESIKKDKIKEGDKASIKYFYDKQLTKLSNKSSKIYEVLYIYKISGDAVLLGKNYITDVYHAKEDILGWVSIKKITIWDHRIAVEPNWDKEAVAERRQKNIKTTFLIDIARAKRFAEKGKMNNKFVVWDNDPYEKRNIGDWRRFPLLGYNKESQIIKAGVIASQQSAEKGSYFPAFAPMYVKGLKYPLFKMVLLVSLRELGDMLTKLDALADAYTASSQRQKLKEVWLELLQSHLGNEYSRERAENMTFAKINEKVFGLPGTSELLNIRLWAITDPSIVSDAKVYNYIEGIKIKRIELDKIYNNMNFKFGFYSYDTPYFWISQDMLP